MRDDDSYWSSEDPSEWLRVLTSPTLVELAARVATSMCRLDESACCERLRAKSLVAFES